MNKVDLRNSIIAQSTTPAQTQRKGKSRYFGKALSLI